jgi:transcriptional regulator with AAA-type ATPase domain
LLDKLSKHIGDFYHREIPQQNAGLALNLTEQAIDRQIERLVSQFGGGASSQGEDGDSQELTRTLSWVPASQMREESRVLTADDFGIHEQVTLGDEEMKKSVLAEVDAMVGMDAAKRFFREIAMSVQFVEQGGNVQLLQTSLNMLVTGNPGTGKTTIARMIAKYL